MRFHRIFLLSSSLLLPAFCRQFRKFSTLEIRIERLKSSLLGDLDFYTSHKAASWHAHVEDFVIAFIE